MDKTELDKVDQEIRLHSSLKHPNILGFVESKQTNEYIYLLLELAENNTLLSHLDVKTGLPELVALRFVYSIACALDFLHDKSIVHRDIRPDNILLDSEFRIKVADLGQARKLQINETTRSIVGTFEYMSPEISNEEKYDSKVDVWSLGCILYELVHG